MTRLSAILRVLLLSIVAGCGRAPAPAPPAPVAPPPRPVSVVTPPKEKVNLNAEKIKAAEEEDAALAPYVAKARESFGPAKKRYLDGLPPAYTFVVVAKIKDDTGLSERAYIAVSGIKDGLITGRIESDVANVKNVKRGDTHSFPETELIDWIIFQPNGAAEEGDTVGKFLNERGKS